MCERWVNDFERFYADMGPRPEGLTLERKNNNGPYSPDNCKWASIEEQSFNCRDSVIVELDGQPTPLVIAADRLGIPRSTVYARRQRGFPQEFWLSKEKVKRA